MVVEKALGMSVRTVQRRDDASARPLNQEQSGRTWLLAEVMAKAIAVMGTREDAERWLVSPAIGLERRRPVDLMATPAGVKLVEDFLERLRYGVYT